MAKTTTKTKSKATLSGSRKYDLNYLCIDLEGHMNYKKINSYAPNNNQLVIDKRTNRSLKDFRTTQGISSYIDATRYFRVYTPFVEDIYDLTPYAFKVFFHMASHMDKDNKVYFNYNTEYKKLKYNTNRSCYNGLVELLEKRFIICAEEDNWYWLNPIYVSRENRLSNYNNFQEGLRQKIDKRIKENNPNYKSFDELPSRRHDILDSEELEDRYFLNLPNTYNENVDEYYNALKDLVDYVYEIEEGVDKEKKDGQEIDMPDLLSEEEELIDE